MARNNILVQTGRLTLVDARGHSLVARRADREQQLGLVQIGEYNRDTPDLPPSQRP